MLRLKGIVYLIISSCLIWHEFSGNDKGKWIPQIVNWGSTNQYLDILVTVFLIIVNITVLVYWFKGLSLTFLMGNLTEEQYKETAWGNVIWWSKKKWYEYDYNTSSNNSSIDKAKRYRESKFANMSNETKAKEYAKTAWIDGLDSNQGKNVESAKRYIDSKLSAMDNEAGYKWLKNE